MIYQKIKNIYHFLQSLRSNIHYGFPGRKLKIIGITGTDGKTTSTTMIYHILKSCGLKVGMISTLNARIDDEIIDIGLHVTTPEPWVLPKLLRKMVDRKIEYVVLESTSSGLDQNRLFGVSFDSSLITQIKKDHIEYHKTWENYAKAKYKIIKKTKKNGCVVLNKDHEKSANWLYKKIKDNNYQNKRRIKWFSLKELRDFQHSVKGIGFKYKNQSFRIPIIGEYNFSNALGVIKICNRYIGSLKAISKALENYKTPTGRMQVMKNNPFGIIIDFAHTPSSLEEAIKSVRKIVSFKDSKIITVFGCAGKRDPERRKMGGISSKYADITLISIEDPRDEDLVEINSQIISYSHKEGGDLKDRFENHKDYEKKELKWIKKDISSKAVFSFDYAEVQNRLDAINFAISIAKKGDIILLTGKAHEKSMAIGDPIVEYSYYEPKVVKKILKNLS